jgi:hypothetical protein
MGIMYAISFLVLISILKIPLLEEALTPSAAG